MLMQSESVGVGLMFNETKSVSIAGPTIPLMLMRPTDGMSGSCRSKSRLMRLTCEPLSCRAS